MALLGMIKRCVPVLLVAAAAVTTSAVAQTAAAGDAAASAPHIMLVGCDDGKAMLSIDNGRSWRMLSSTAAASARRQLGITAPLLRRSDAGVRSAATMAPNPTTGETTIRYTLPEPAEVTLSLHDARGNEVLRDSELRSASGEQASTVDAGMLPAGTYFVRITALGRVIGGGTLGVTH